ncbi:NrfD/PsrC family molybdoenzyme membrane anchor subunit, partial [Streptomyces mayteni]
MSEAEVRRDGLAEVRPGRDAPVGAGLDGLRRPVADSYYGRPVVRAPSWVARDVAGYLFLGGLAGAGSVLAAGAELTGRSHTARAMKLGSLGAVSLSTAALVNDLGRPARFCNMLRVLKPTSPMSVGSWLLAGYCALAGVAAADEVASRAPRAGRAATLAAGCLGPCVATYTGVLLADTAIPAWHEAHRELPYLFAGSAATAAAGMALLAGPLAENRPARRVAVLAVAAALAALRSAQARAGLVAETYRSGAAGRLLGVAGRPGTAGAAAAALLGGRL